MLVKSTPATVMKPILLKKIFLAQDSDRKPYGLFRIAPKGKEPNKQHLTLFMYFSPYDILDYL